MERNRKFDRKESITLHSTIFSATESTVLSRELNLFDGKLCFTFNTIEIFFFARPMSLLKRRQNELLNGSLKYEIPGETVRMARSKARNRFFFPHRQWRRHVTIKALVEYLHTWLTLFAGSSVPLGHSVARTAACCNWWFCKRDSYITQTIPRDRVSLENTLGGVNIRLTGATASWDSWRYRWTAFRSGCCSDPWKRSGR